MKKKSLGPGDSTVVELTFNTKNYKTMVKKNATIYSNDLANSQSKIYVSAKAYVKQDTTLPISWAPDKINFTNKEREFEIIITNKSDKELTLETISDGYGGLHMKVKNDRIMPGEETKIEFKWTDGFQKEHFERSMTFVASGDSKTRFTVPFVVQGTDPTPKKSKAKTKPPAKNRSTSTPAVKKGDAAHDHKSGD